MDWYQSYGVKAVRVNSFSSVGKQSDELHVHYLKDREGERRQK